jgi:hypothetical protein
MMASASRVWVPWNGSSPPSAMPVQNGELGHAHELNTTSTHLNPFFFALSNPEQVRGRKALVLEPQFVAPLGLVVDALTLKEHGVEMCVLCDIIFVLFCRAGPFFCSFCAHCHAFMASTLDPA